MAFFCKSSLRARDLFRRFGWWLEVSENGGISVVRKGVNLVSRQGTPAVQVILNQTPLEGPMILRVL